MSINIGVIMDPISSVNYKKDSTMEMLWRAADRGWSIQYMEMGDLYLEDGHPRATMRPLTVKRDPDDFYQLGAAADKSLTSLDVILMRKDPPFDMEYIYVTYMLERAELENVLIINKPASLRDCNEKIFTAWFPELTPPTLITRNSEQIKSFIATHGDTIIKPLDGMGGTSIFRLTAQDPNINVVLEHMTEHDTRFAMIQTFLPEIVNGDKRILMINGKPADFVLARIPKEGETRGNLAAGGTGVGEPISESDRKIANTVGPELTKRGIIFAGLDVIGDRITEINVTSPTCMRELNDQFGCDIAGDLLNEIEGLLN
ncbi:MAG: glutathione synthase [Proteobacteria bacterium]|jgi:glutathione synthase|nr:glutathione synthase [Pseudomonadota bacterium]